MADLRPLRSLRFAPLLVATFFAMVVSPPLVEGGYVGASAAVSLPAVLLGALIAIGDTGRFGRIALALWLVTLVLEVAVHAPVGPRPAIVARALDALFLAFVTAVIVRKILRTEQVSFDTLLGGLCAYLLIGFFFVVVFSVVELVHPGSFLDGGDPLLQLRRESLQMGRFPGLVYYSFVTLTTLGYGDITPTTALARSLSTLEAVLGQFYLAVLVAALVGMHLAQRATRGPR